MSEFRLSVIVEDIAKQETIIDETLTSHQSDRKIALPRQLRQALRPREPRTGYEVVEHILGGMLRDDTYIAYLNKSSPTSPYDLVVVPKPELHREHFIMSSFGVMHVRPNGENGQFAIHFILI